MQQSVTFVMAPLAAHPSDAPVQEPRLLHVQQPDDVIVQRPAPTQCEQIPNTSVGSAGNGDRQLTVRASRPSDNRGILDPQLPATDH
jgi:hypothetical protein